MGILQERRACRIPVQSRCWQVRFRRDLHDVLAGFEFRPASTGSEQALSLNRGVFAPAAGLTLFGSIGESAPDTWGRRLMQSAERRRAEREDRAVRTLPELDYLLGVSDVSRLGALRFRHEGDEIFQSPTSSAVPGVVELGRSLQVTDRILREEETDEDLQLIFAPCSSLGGARPKASVVDVDGRLSIAKFPRARRLPKRSLPLPRRGATSLRLPARPRVKSAGWPARSSIRI
jgi:serine/threonine-protein kinase HipA